jgi:hypothetical protein
MATKICDGKDPIILTKYEMIEKLCQIGCDRDGWRKAAISFECQLYMVDPGNPIFANYTKEKLRVMDETVTRWKAEIEEAHKRAESTFTQKEEDT